MGMYRKQGGECVALCPRLDCCAVRAACYMACYVPRIFAPNAGELTTRFADICAHLKFIAIARASKLLLQTVPAGFDHILPIASDALLRAVLHLDEPVACPNSSELAEWADSRACQMQRIGVGGDDRQANKRCAEERSLENRANLVGRMSKIGDAWIVLASHVS